MKKFSIFVFFSAIFLLFVGCTEVENTVAYPIKTEQEILEDLNQSDKFWSYMAPGNESRAKETYVITDISILVRHTEDGISDYIALTATAESSFAQYVSPIELRYMYDDENGYVLNMVYREYLGQFMNIIPPTDEFAEKFFDENLKRMSAELIEASIKPYPGSNPKCDAVIKYQYRDSSEHCMVSVENSYPCDFSAGFWEINTSPSSSKTDYTYDTENKVYYAFSRGASPAIINAYTIDGIQYYDSYIYSSRANISNLTIEYGFAEKHLNVVLTTSYVGNLKTIIGSSQKNIELCESIGPVSDDVIIEYFRQVYGIIGEPFICDDTVDRYVYDNWSGDLIYRKETDEYGWTVARAASEGTMGYQWALEAAQNGNGWTP